LSLRVKRSVTKYSPFLVRFISALCDCFAVVSASPFRAASPTRTLTRTLRTQIFLSSYLLSPNAIIKVRQRLKILHKSTRKEFLMEIRRVYWGKSVFWNSAYFVASCGGAAVGNSSIFAVYLISM